MPANKARALKASASDIDPTEDARVPEENLEGDDDAGIPLDVEDDLAIPDEEERVINVES